MDAYRVQRRRQAVSAGSLQRQSNFVPPPRPLRFEPPRDGMAEVREFSVNVAAIGISDDRGDTANKRWCFLSERFFKNPSKGLFITNSRGSRLPPPVRLVISSMFRRNLVAKLPVNPVEAFCAFVTQSDGEFAKAGAIVFRAVPPPEAALPAQKNGPFCSDVGLVEMKPSPHSNRPFPPGSRSSAMWQQKCAGVSTGARPYRDGAHANLWVQSALAAILWVQLVNYSQTAPLKTNVLL